MRDSGHEQHHGADIGVVIVTANTLAMTLECLNTLPVGSADVVVVDNGSTDGTAGAIARQLPDVQVIALPEGVGFAEACNVGAAHTSAALLLFLNSDIATRPGAIDALVSALDEHPTAVAAGGRLVDPGTDNTQAAYRPRTFPSATSLAMQLVGLARAWPSNPVTRRHLGGHLPEDRTSDVDQPAGACLLVRRDAFEAIGGFDEGYWFWFEDVDLARRLRRLGTLLYVPVAVFEHRGGASFGQWDGADIVRSRQIGLARYVGTHFRWWQRLAVAGVLGPVLVARGLLAAPGVRHAHFSALRALPAVLLGRRRGAT
jgi:N-acetylglucosaminyl-diphospho-decaprenol L-rhamnosyltransferase